jgi:hypothetical protein
MILTHVLVPPVAIRPSVKVDAGAGSNEDDLTMKLQEIIHVNMALRTAVTAGAPMKMVCFVVFLLFLLACCGISELVSSSNVKCEHVIAHSLTHSLTHSLHMSHFTLEN